MNRNSAPKQTKAAVCENDYGQYSVFGKWNHILQVLEFWWNDHSRWSLTENRQNALMTAMITSNINQLKRTEYSSWQWQTACLANDTAETERTRLRYYHSQLLTRHSQQFPAKMVQQPSSLNDSKEIIGSRIVCDRNQIYFVSDNVYILRAISINKLYSDLRYNILKFMATNCNYFLKITLMKTNRLII